MALVGAEVLVVGVVDLVDGAEVLVAGVLILTGADLEDGVMILSGAEVLVAGLVDLEDGDMILSGVVMVDGAAGADSVMEDLDMVDGQV